MKPSTYFLSIVIFTFFIVGTIAAIGEVVNSSGASIDDEKFAQFNKTFNKYDNIRSAGSDLEGTITGADTDFGVFGVLNSLISTAWNSLKLVFSSLSFMTTVFGGLYAFFAIPAWVGNLIVTFISISITFAIFAAIFQKDV